MIWNSPPLEKRTSSGAWACLMPMQIALAVGSALWIAFAPRSGEPVVLIPIGTDGNRHVIARLSDPDTKILGRANWAGSYVVRDRSQNAFDALIRHGVLTLNATADGCTPSDKREYMS